MVELLGAAAGAAFGQGLHALAPGLVSQAGSYALIGMGAVFAAAGRAPITAVVILFELTGEYTIMLPLMLAAFVAIAMSRALSEDTIYTVKLRRRGIDLQGVHSCSRGRHLPGHAARADTPDLRRLARTAYLLSTHGALPLVDEHGKYAGVVGLDALGAGALEDELGSATAGSLASFTEARHSDDPLRRAMALLAHPDGARGLPVIDTSGSPIGWLSHPDVVRRLIRSPQSAEP